MAMVATRRLVGTRVLRVGPAGVPTTRKSMGREGVRSGYTRRDQRPDGKRSRDGREFDDHDDHDDRNDRDGRESGNLRVPDTELLRGGSEGDQRRDASWFRMVRCQDASLWTALVWSAHDPRAKSWERASGGE